MLTIEIEGRQIGHGQPCLIVAEGCDNHLGSLATAKEMVRAAKLAGADAIKFQHHLPDEEMLREGIPKSSNFDIPLYDFLKKYALRIEDHAELRDYCGKRGIIYLCTPFSWKAAKELYDIGVQAFKIGSGELTDLPTLERIGRLGKPMILSTGMATLDEVAEAVETVQSAGAPVALMNCVSEYPARHRDVNLGVIGELARRFQVVVGHSDHTPDIHTCIGAVALGAKLIEKHFILDKRQPGPDQSVSIDPMELHELVRAVRHVEDAMGAEKVIHEGERQIRSWAHRSVVTIADVRKGEVLTENTVWTKRPGTGIPAKNLRRILGRVAGRDIPKDSLVQWSDLEAEQVRR